MSDETKPKTTATADDLLVMAVLILVGYGVPADIQEVLIHGDPERGIKPGALAQIIKAVR